MQGRSYIKCILFSLLLDMKEAIIMCVITLLSQILYENETKLLFPYGEDT